MGFLSYQSWLLTAALTLATLLAVRTAMMIRGWGSVEDTSHRRQELKVLYDPTDAGNGLSPSARRSHQAIECVFASQSFADMTM